MRGNLLLTTPDDQAPVALDIRSPLDLVYECFVKLGLRYICVLRDGKFAGIVCFPAPQQPRSTPTRGLILQYIANVSISRHTRKHL